MKSSLPQGESWREGLKSTLTLALSQLGRGDFFKSYRLLITQAAQEAEAETASPKLGFTSSISCSRNLINDLI